jgi:diaminopimelate decarboxylase
MEDDVLAQNISFPENLELGDQIIFCDSGAYDRSMSYEFGRG